MLIDPRTMFGQPGPVAYWFEFTLPGEDGPATILVSVDGSQIVMIGVRPPRTPDRSCSGCAGITTSLGEVGVLAPAVTASNPFNDAVVKEVLWAYQQVDITPLFALGWFGVRGEFSVTQTLYRGITLPASETFADVVVIARRRMGSTVVPFGSVIQATGAQTMTDPGSGIMVSFVSTPAIGSSSAETVVSIVSPGAIDVSLSSTLITSKVPGVPPPPPIRFEETPIGAHWFDLGWGRRYRDVIYPTQALNAGQTVVDVELDLLDHHFIRIASHRVGLPAADGGGFGAWIVGRTVGGGGLMVVVDSYHESYKAVRYRLRYTIEGGGSGLPPMEKLESLR